MSTPKPTEQAISAKPTFWQRLRRYLRDRWNVAHNAATSMLVCDQLLRAQAGAIARDNAIRRLVYSHLAKLTGRAVCDLDREYLALEADAYKKLLIEMGDDNPKVAEFLDTRPPEQRNFQ
jgi:hypothetical protein